MNALSSVSHRLYTAALAEESGGRRRAPRSAKEAIIELARQHVVAVGPKREVSPAPVTPKVVRFDSRLRA